MTPVYDPLEFARWLSEAYEQSSFKSWQAVADQVGSTRSTLSRLAGAKPQSLNGKPGQPASELVIKLANLFGRDVDEALMVGGHAPLNRSMGLEIGDHAMVKLSDQDLSPEDQEEIAEELALAYELIMARRKAKKAKTE